MNQQAQPRSRASRWESRLPITLADSSDLSTASMVLARGGVPVFGCIPGGKQPRAQHGFRDACSDQATMGSWWQPWPDANIAMPTHEKPDEEGRNEATSAHLAVGDTVALFASLRWPEDVARAGIEYIRSRLIRSGSRETAFQALRRDRHAHALLDVDQRAWLVFLRAVLGYQHPDRHHTACRRRVLLRLLIGDDRQDLKQDRALVAHIPSVRQPGRRATLGGAHG
jgi:hypothetical protein